MRQVGPVWRAVRPRAQAKHGDALQWIGKPSGGRFSRGGACYDEWCVRPFGTQPRMRAAPRQQANGKRALMRAFPSIKATSDASPERRQRSKLMRNQGARGEATGFAHAGAS